MTEPLKLLFCHDHRFVRGGDGRVYSPGQFGYGMWRRYLDAFNQLVVAGRERPLGPGEALAQLTLSSGPRVSFVFVPNFASPQALLWPRGAARAALTSVVGAADAVIVRLPSETGLRAAWIARRLGKPWASEVVGCVWDALWNYGTWQAKAYAPVALWRMRRAIRASSHTLYVTRDFLQRRYPSRGIAAAVSNVEIARPPAEVLTRRLDRIASGGDGQRPLVLGLIGNLQHRYKGLGTALAALAGVRARLPAFELRVLGTGDPGPWRAEAERLGLARQVHFCGTRPGGQPILEWLDEVDLYLQPSFQEGLPRALIEAMSRACPALASTAGGIPELLAPACLHRPGDVAALAGLIRRVVCDRSFQTVAAERNFSVAQDYASEILDARRRKYWRDFSDYARQQRGERCRVVPIQAPLP